jgi:tungstate transport system ATP-binding protein
VTRPVLELERVAVAYGGRTTLEVDRFTVQRGEVLTIVGPNGAGKSTLLRVLALLETPARGTVRFAGQAVGYEAGPLLSLRRRMAIAVQAPLLCDTTVFGNVALGLRFRRVRAAEIERRVRSWLERFGIAHLASRPARSLSGGEAQRTSLARAFVLDPEVLFLDEPFGALDAPTREALLLDLELALRDAGKTTVFVTHDRGEALMLGDRIAVVMNGRVVQTDVPERVFSAPSTAEVARFVGADTIVAGVVRDRRADLCVVAVGGGDVEAQSDALPSEHVLVCLRPEDVILSRSDEPTPLSSARNVLLGKVRRIVTLDARVRVDIDAGFDLRAIVSKQSVRDLGLAEGQEVRATFKATAAHVIRRHDGGTSTRPTA